MLSVFGPGAHADVVHSSRLGVITLRLPHAQPPIVTVVPVERNAPPLIVTTWPPDGGPTFGKIDVNSGGPQYVNALCSVPCCPSSFTTVTETGPGSPFGAAGFPMQ